MPGIKKVRIAAERAEERKDQAVAVVLERILVEEVGQLGLYQLNLLVFAALPVCLAAFACAEFIFTTARIPTRCLIPQCDTKDTAFIPPWLLNAVPGSSNSSFQSCERFANGSSPNPPSPGQCPASLFNRSQTIKCQGNRYENDYTVVYDFGLACNEWRRSYIGSVREIGTLVMLPITGFVSDRWGRRVALVVCACVVCVLGFSRSFVKTYNQFVTLQFTETVLRPGILSSCFILVSEMVGPDYKSVAGAFFSTLYAVGNVLLGLIALHMPQWRVLTLVVYAPLLLVIAYIFIMPESVRWLMRKGRYEKAHKILEHAAKMNNKQLSENAMEGLLASAEAQKAKTKEEETLFTTKLLKIKCIMIPLLAAPVWWFTNTLVYYGLAIYAFYLPEQPHFNYIVVALADIPAVWVATLLRHIGSRCLLLGGYWFCAVCQLALYYLLSYEEGTSWTVILVVYLLSKCGIAAVLMPLNTYSVQLFPPEYRHDLILVATMLGRVGTIVAPLVPAMAQHRPSLPHMLFAVCTFLSGLLVLAVPSPRHGRPEDTSRLYYVIFSIQHFLVY